MKGAESAIEWMGRRRKGGDGGRAMEKGAEHLVASALPTILEDDDAAAAECDTRAATIATSLPLYQVTPLP